MVTKYLSGVAKKFASFDKDYLIVLVIFLLVLFSSKGFATVSAPEQVVVADKTIFYVDITNDSDKLVNLEVNFFAPIKSEVTAPKTISPRQKVTAKITLYNTKFDQATQINSKVEANMGDKVEQKEIILSFTGKRYSNGSELSQSLSGLFSFGVFTTQLETFTLMDWAVFWILVIIAAVLVIAFISRIKNMV